MLESVKQLNDELRNQDVFIVGGGYSVKHMDLSLLEHKKIIAVNDAYSLFTTVTAMYWCDSSWPDDHERALEKYPCMLRFTKRKNIDLTKHIKGPYNSTYLKFTGDFGYDPNKECVRGNNGGTQALNLVINMNPKRIFLLGFDMRRIENNSHWHDPKGVVTDNIYTSLFIPSINSLADEIKPLKNKPEIFNCSEFSAIKCFTIIKLTAEVINDHQC